MAHGMQQVQSLSQQQVLAPQLQQSLQILQAPMLELRNLIQQEIQTNPVVEEEITEPSIEDRQQEDKEFQEEFDRLAKLDEEWRDYMAQNSSLLRQEPARTRSGGSFSFDSIVSNETLQQHLLEQVHSGDLEGPDQKIAELIIGNIDDLGFLQTAPEEIAQNSGIALEDIQRVLAIIQTFHPVGVGARDLRECLLIQLRRIGKEQSARVPASSSGTWRTSASGGSRRSPAGWARPSSRCSAARNFIATLDPKPGQIFTPDPNNYVLPDVTVEQIGGDGPITLNGEQIPHLRISNTYKDLMAHDRRQHRGQGLHPRQDPQREIPDQEHPPAAADHLEHRARDRRSGRRSSSSSAARALKPMTMVQIADAVGVHETTVSRAISGKYIATPQGVFEMKYFFTPGYQTAEGDSMSNTSVKESIAALVKDEDSRQPALATRKSSRSSRKARHPHRPPHRGQVSRPSWASCRATCGSGIDFAAGRRLSKFEVRNQKFEGLGPADAGRIY